MSADPLATILKLIAAVLACLAIVGCRRDVMFPPQQLTDCTWQSDAPYCGIQDYPARVSLSHWTVEKYCVAYLTLGDSRIVRVDLPYEACVREWTVRYGVK